MDHVAILSSKDWLDKIISGEKTIESRWTKNKIAPFEKISKGDKIYFKVSGKPVSAAANVCSVSFFNNPGAEGIRKILEKYSRQIGVEMSFYNQVKNKRYCTLIKINNARKISPFTIDKKGYGNSVAWITVGDINKIRI